MEVDNMLKKRKFSELKIDNKTGEKNKTAVRHQKSGTKGNQNHHVSKEFKDTLFAECRQVQNIQFMNT